MATIKVCDTEGCNVNENMANVTSTQEGDFCEHCMAGIRFTNEVALAYQDVSPDQEWAEMQDDRYQSWVREY